tara:strand:+ start:106 stop:885 length:780 start_codon:yes stop_codon:yes gene_type:complete
MNKKLKSVLRPYARMLLKLGFDPRKILLYKFYPQFKRDKSKWLKQGGMITRIHMILGNYSNSAGTAKGHYFHQDLLVAKLINEHNPKRHVDIASRVDGFVAHVASFREIEVLDIRPLEKSVHQNIRFRKADLMSPQNLGETDSLSCLHAIEHFGLGRYTDPIDVDGHNKGITNLVNLVSVGGRLYVSFPIGQSDEVHFNAHRVFHARTIFKHPSISKYMKLVRFDYVDDNGDLHLNKDVSDVNAETKYGCGIYTFEKVS